MNPSFFRKYADLLDEVVTPPVTPPVTPAPVEKPVAIVKPPVTSKAQLDKFRQDSGNPDATLGQFLNKQRGLTARIGGANDPAVIAARKAPKINAMQGSQATANQTQTSNYSGQDIRTANARDASEAPPAQGFATNIPPKAPDSAAPEFKGDYTVNADPDAEKVPSTPKNQTGYSGVSQYQYNNGEKNPLYRSGEDEPAWSTMGDLDAKRAEPPPTKIGEPRIIPPEYADTQLPANVGDMNPEDSARELRAAQATAGKPVLEPGARVVGTGTGGSVKTGSGGLLTTRSPDEITWSNQPQNMGKQYPGAERVAADQAASAARGENFKQGFKKFFGMGDKQPAVTAPPQQTMEDHDMSELRRLSGMAPLNEKAVSKQQQKFMGMVHAMQKSKKVKNASPELKKASNTMTKKAATDFASTTQKSLPKRVSEGMEFMDESQETLKHIANRFKYETKMFMQSGNMDTDLFNALKDYYREKGEMPHKAVTGDAQSWVEEHFYADMGSNMSEGMSSNKPDALSELARLAGLSEGKLDECGDMGSSMHDDQEGNMSVSTNMSSDGTKNVTISASGEQAAHLLQMLKIAGLENSPAADRARIIIAQPHQEEMMDVHDEEMMDEGEHGVSNYANTPDEEYQSISTQLRQGTDLNREKKQFKHSYRQGDNPMAMDDFELEESLASMLESIKVKEDGAGGISAEEPYRDSRTGKMVIPPKGATMPPADSEYPPGDRRNSIVKTPNPSSSMPKAPSGFSGIEAERSGIKGATMPPADSQYAPGDRRNSISPRKAR